MQRTSNFLKRKAKYHDPQPHPSAGAVRRSYDIRMTQRHWTQNDRITLVTTVTMNRVPLFQDPSNAREAVECLYRVQSLHPFFLYGFVVMPDHIHLLMKIPAPERLSNIIGSYKSGLTFDLGIKKLWQSRFHMRIVKSPCAALHYIHMNPVKKGLTESPENYPWSSASGRWDISGLDR